MNKFIKSAGAAIGILGLGLGISIPTPASTIYAQCDSYINIHSSYTLDSQCIGKIYNGNVAQVISETTDKYYIQSGDVTGWVDKAYFTDQAPDGYTVATIYPQLLNVRCEPSQDAEIFGAVYEGQQIEAINYENGWVTLAFEDGSYGYVNGQYVGLNTYYGTAESKEEEENRLEQEYIAYMEQQAVAQQVLDNGIQENYYENQNYQEDENVTQYNQAGTGDVTQSSGTTTSSQVTPPNNSSSVEQTTNTSSNETSAAPATSSTSNTNTSGSGAYLSDYAKQYVGNPYVWGGTSLQTGADCSGFTKAVLNANGIQVNGRTAADQAAGGTKISLSEAQAGDLIYYDNGSGVYHIAIYNGDGTVTHSTNSASGVTVSNMNYSGNAAGAVRYW